MGFQTFVKIDGVPGESVDEGHKEWIEALSVEWGLHRIMGERKDGEEGRMMYVSSRVNFEPFSFTKGVDKATPKLMQVACQKDPVGISIEFCRAGGDKMKYMEFKFNGCRIVGLKLKTGDSAETLPVENVLFDYEKITITYNQQSRTSGGSSGTVVSVWDLKTNS